MTLGGSLAATTRAKVAAHPRTIVLAVVAVAVAAVPIAAGGFTLYLATDSVVRAIAAVGLALLIAQAGLLSLGHAAFFGLGGYTVALTATHLTTSPLITLAAAMGAAALYAAVTGPLALRSHGIFFVMITLAFGQLLFAVAEQWVAVTRGSDGIAGVPRPMLFTGSATFHLLAVGLLVAVLVIGERLTRSSVGRVVGAARQNEGKTRALGYDVFRYRYLVFVVSAAITSLGGALQVHHRGFVGPGDLYWVTSGTLVLMVLLGGGRSLLGAAIGAVVFVQLESFFTELTELWEALVGVLLIVAVFTNYGRSIQDAALAAFQRRFGARATATDGREA